MAHFWQSAVFSPRGLALVAGLLLAAAPAGAHDTLSFDPNAPPEFPLGPNPVLGSPAAVVIQGMAIARLRPTDFEIDLTVADNAAYKLLDSDPYHPPATPPAVAADSSSGLPMIRDPHFEADKPLLAKRGESLFIINNNGQTLNPLAVAVDLTESQDVVFHLTYPRVAPGALRVFITYFNQVPAGQKDIVTVRDGADKTIAATTVGANTPFLDVDVPGATPAAPAPAKAFSLGKALGIIAGLVAGIAALIFLLKFLRRPERA